MPFSQVYKHTPQTQLIYPIPSHPPSPSMFEASLLKSNPLIKTIIKKQQAPKPTSSPDEIQNSVSSLSWNHNTTEMIPILAETTWLGQLKFYQLTVELDGNCIAKMLHSRTFKETSLLKSCWNSKDKYQVVFGDSDGVIRCLNIGDNNAHGKETTMGSHSAPINSLHFLDNLNLFVSTSYSNQIKFWDVRQQKQSFRIDSDHKICCASVGNNLLALGMSDYTFSITDIRHGSGNNTLDMASPLGQYSQLQCMAMHPTRSLLMLGAFDGRSTLLNLDNDPSSLSNQNAEILFHHCSQGLFGPEQQQMKVAIGHPINAMGFSPTHPNCLYSASSKHLVIYNFDTDRILHVEDKQGPFTAVAMNSDGGCLAYATGNDWHTGRNEPYPTDVCIRLLTDEDYQGQKVSQQ